MGFEGKSRRLRERVKLALPVRVHCRETAEHEWTEMSRLVDVTPFGARFPLTHPVERGRIVRLTNIETGLSLIAAVRGARTGPDGIPRLHLEFIDRQWPLEGVE